MQFKDFNLPTPLLTSLERMQFTTPTEIQKQAIPIAMAGNDILGSAQTGTGKTGAYAIPIISKIMNDRQGLALVLAPTRELALQVITVFHQMLGRESSIKTALLIGGDSMGKQFRQLKDRPQIIVGTPGRVTDHLERKSLILRNTSVLVLDETDRMLDMGFGIQIDKILTFVPRTRQTLMFSATLPPQIERLSGKYLNDPKRIAVGPTHVPATQIQQEIVRTTEATKYADLLTQLTKRQGTIIIFVKTRDGADRLAHKLCKANHKARAMHGKLQQREREKVIIEFRRNPDSDLVMVATDVAARGLDIPHIKHVINFDLPQCPEDYIHRIGRTARAGAEGSAVSFISPEDGRRWKAIHRLLNPQEATTSSSKNPREPWKPRAGGRPRVGTAAKNQKPFRFNKPRRHKVEGGRGESISS